MKKYQSLVDFEHYEIIELKHDDFNLSNWSASVYIDGHNTHNVDSIDKLNDDLASCWEIHKIDYNTKSLVLYLNILNK